MAGVVLKKNNVLVGMAEKDHGWRCENAGFLVFPFGARKTKAGLYLYGG